MTLHSDMYWTYLWEILCQSSSVGLCSLVVTWSLFQSFKLCYWHCSIHFFTVCFVFYGSLFFTFICVFVLNLFRKMVLCPVKSLYPFVLISHIPSAPLITFSCWSITSLAVKSQAISLHPCQSLQLFISMVLVFTVLLFLLLDFSSQRFSSSSRACSWLWNDVLSTFTLMVSLCLTNPYKWDRLWASINPLNKNNRIEN